MIPYLIDNLINAARFIVGLVLIIIAMQAYFKIRTQAMFFLALGFILLTIGDLFSAAYYIDNARMNSLFSDIFDILGMILLIAAIRKS